MEENNNLDDVSMFQKENKISGDSPLMSEDELDAALNMLQQEQGAESKSNTETESDKENVAEDKAEQEKSEEIEQKDVEEETIKEKEEDATNDTELSQEVQDELMDEVEKQTVIEEDTKENDAVKKYLFYISKDFVDTIDKLSIDERTAFINDAIQTKLDLNKNNSQLSKTKFFISQAVVVFLTICIFTPIAIFIMNKAIMVTFENYKYSQSNFEKLYKQRFEKDRAYMRSVQYNQQIQEEAVKKLKNK